MLRGLLVGGITWVVASLFTGFEVAHPLLALAMLVLVAVVFAGFGVVSAIWAQSFEQVNFFPTFFITPLTFLGGVFYSVEMLPPGLRRFTLANPIFYMVDGVRFGMLGISDAAPWAGAALLAGLAAAVALVLLTTVSPVFNPPKWDEFVYVYDSHRVASGQVPYRDFFNFTTPGIFLFLASVERLVGQSSITLGRYAGLGVVLFTALAASA